MTSNAINNAKVQFNLALCEALRNRQPFSRIEDRVVMGQKKN